MVLPHFWRLLEIIMVTVTVFKLFRALMSVFSYFSLRWWNCLNCTMQQSIAFNMSFPISYFAVMFCPWWSCLFFSVVSPNRSNRAVSVIVSSDRVMDMEMATIWGIAKLEIAKLPLNGSYTWLPMGYMYNGVLRRLLLWKLDIHNI